ncbi:O-acetyl-ADP-ribose deacetylase [Thalassotalea sp. PS06]|uniref:O-acetyl-ADP-ribose deacetylase n=1 Tax=Thalassotalea sp. PS06 TaxID=2594005 RepID=UPI0011621202|nr:O-acetyl-ADP-ribose deacetylase [Thalassotalea sp. PS06]QDP02371.1 O-acetyl-ADP-ribose deacetylase [Thalassotalea sp. PS06]
MSGNIEIVQGDITKADTDAIVNAANPMMLGGGGVDGAIHRAAGPALLQECRKVKAINGIRCPFGEARITSAGILNAKYVIHTAGPIYRNEDHPQQVLACCYRNCLELALEHQCQSIAFPAISCGAYGYPLEEAAEIAVKVCSREKYTNIRIQFFLFSDELEQIWKKAISQITDSES